MKATRSLEDCQTYLADYVFCGVKFVREVKDGFVFAGFESFDYPDGTLVKVFKDEAIPLSDYKVLKK
jgi:hypothetical protein